MKTLALLLASLALTFSAASVRADGMIVVNRPIPLPHHPYAFAPLEIENHLVTVAIDDQVALTKVDQTFYNPNDQNLEGTYIFPIPAGAQIDKFTMDINGRAVEAELLDATKARALYEDIVRKMKDPALLEYAGQGLFKVRIYPIEAHGRKHITLSYTQLLKNDSGLVQYVYPLNTEKFSSAPIKTVSVTCAIRTQRPLKAVYSPSHKTEVRRDGDTKAVVSFELNNAKPDTDFSLYFSTVPPAAGAVGVNVLSFNDGGAALGAPDAGGYFLMLISPGELTQGEVAGKDVVFLLDTSGSMAEHAKIKQACKALQYCVGSLNAGDRFQVIRFATDVEPLFAGLVDASDANRARAAHYIEGLHAAGATALDDALTAAVGALAGRNETDRPAAIIFLTDGQPTVGEVGEDNIIAHLGRVIGDQGIRVFSFGIGTNDINTHLLDKIAEQTHGLSQYVLPDEDIEQKVSNFYAKIQNPVLAHVQVDVADPVRISKAYPWPLPDLFKGDQLVLLGRYTGQGSAAVTLEGTVNGKPRKFTYEAAFAQASTEHAFIPKLWAVRRVGYLLDQVRLHGENADLRDEITQLARQYAIVTPYTAYLILEDEDHRNVPMTQRTMQTQLQGPGAQALSLDDQRRVRGEFADRAKALQTERSGAAAVQDSQVHAALQSAANLTAPAAAAPQAGAGWGGRAGVAPGGKRELDAVDVLAANQQNARFVASRTFYQNGATWIDTQVQDQRQRKHQKVKFNSDEYFALLNQNAHMAQWLSLGPKVQLVLGDTVYEVSDE